MATAKKSNRKTPVQIKEGDLHRQIVFTDDAEDRFVKSCQWVFEAARLGISRDVWLHELRALIDHVRRWAEQHKDEISGCYAAARDNQIAILVSAVPGRYDFALAKALTDLDFELSEKFKVCPCDVLQIPKGSSKFSDSRGTLVIHGDSSGTQAEVAAQS